MTENAAAGPGRIQRGTVRGIQAAEKPVLLTVDQLRKSPRRAVGDAPVVPLFLIVAGMYLLWYGVHYFGRTKDDGSVMWPTDPIKAVLQGKPIPSGAKGPTAQDILKSSAGLTNPTTPADIQNAAANALGPASQAKGSGTAYNINVGKLLAAKYGWGPGTPDWPYLESGWQEESGWSTTAAYDHADPYNHAYGIPQANPGTKMASAGADWKTNPATQISWGLKYIHDTYGSPSRVPHWSPHGPTAGYVGY